MGAGGDKGAALGRTMKAGFIEKVVELRSERWMRRRKLNVILGE